MTKKEKLQKEERDLYLRYREVSIKLEALIDAENAKKKKKQEKIVQTQFKKVVSSPEVRELKNYLKKICPEIKGLKIGVNGSFSYPLSVDFNISHNCQIFVKIGRKWIDLDKLSNFTLNGLYHYVSHRNAGRIWSEKDIKGLPISADI